MKAKLLEHLLSILLVTCTLVGLAKVMENSEASREAGRTKAIEPYLKLDFIDLDDPLQRALLNETLNVFYPDKSARNDSLIREIESFRQEQFTNTAYKTGGEERGLTGAKLIKLGWMYLQFILVYLIVMILTYHAAQSLAILRFVRLKQNRTSYLAELYLHATGAIQGSRGSSFYLRILSLSAMALARGAAYAVLFAPAYVIGYSLKSTFDSDSSLFLVILGVVSNGLLINYANKLFTFLLTENRKGYVQTAIVKNLSASYSWGTPDGVPYRAVLHPKSLFPSHVFRHIYLNARYQFLPSLKEHASFLITGLIIIEMALNIHGRLGYELLQNILYKQYTVAMCIIVGIFLIVKGTEIVVDIWSHRESRKYENR